MAVDKLEKTGQPFRVAIDVSIWQFQTQAGQGGSNPAIRTFYYRLLRLLSISVQPIFIFDGPHKPPFKRNKKISHHGASVPNMLTKQMLKLFGFPFYQAPGEAEAECALLQREGIVDAVLSEDVDTLMFGCGQTLRNWSSEGSRGNKSPTHVNVYNATSTKEGSSGLDREGMVLIALMSGGDYITEGIPGCGIKVACQAARAGYGKSLCQLSRTDAAGLEAWRKDLAHEIQKNESKYFRTKHKTLTIPDTFPNREVLGYYTHPVVSSASKIEKLKDEIVWDGEVDVTGLRLFVADAFEWTNRGGALKFIRGLAPVLLVHKLLARRDRRDSFYGDLVLIAMNEMELVRAIGGSRNHFSTDGIRELRLIYMPIDIVGLDLDAEYDDSEDYGRDGLAPVGDDNEIEGYLSNAPAGVGEKRGSSQYDPTVPDKVWVSATIAKIGVPLKVEDYEESLRDPKKFLKAKSAAKRAATKKPAMLKGAMDRFVTTSKPGARTTKTAVSKPLPSAFREDEDSLPPIFLAPSLGKLPSSHELPKTRNSRPIRSASIRPSIGNPPKTKSTAPSKPRTKQTSKAEKEKPTTNTNPWTLASSQTSPKATVKITKPSVATQKPKISSPTILELLSSSPGTPSPRPGITRAAESTPKGRQSLSPPASPSPLPRHLEGQKRAFSHELHQELEIPNSVTISRHRSVRNRDRAILLESPAQSRARTPSREDEGCPSPREEAFPGVLRDSDNDAEDNAERLSDGEVAGKIDVGSPTPAQRTTAPLSSSPPPSPIDAFEHQVEQAEEAELEPLPKQNMRTQTPPAKGIVIDLSSSPPLPASISRSHLRSPSCSALPRPNDDPHAVTKRGRGARETREKSKGTYIVLCEPHIGAWREISEEDLEALGEGTGGERDGERSKETGRRLGLGLGLGARREGVWRYSEVEVLDLTED